jgi:cyclopropane fatty-acyl-phospholipid synthase-like methyltransferase
MIETMPLYVHVERIYAELAQMGIGPADPLRPDQLYPFDQFHYHGVDAVRQAARQINLTDRQHVLDVGSGLGGPARCLASEFGCRVTALELQPALHEVATDLTARCVLDVQIRHVRGDALSQALPVAGFDAVISFMTIHHIEERARLLKRLATLLKPDGALFIEDLYTRAPFSPSDSGDVERLLFGKAMTSREAYEADLRAAGFTHLDIEDPTEDWALFCADRAAAFRADRARFVRVHGQALFDGLDDFFSGVARLFASGSLGGLRIVGHAPGTT